MKGIACSTLRRWKADLNTRNVGFIGYLPPYFDPNDRDHYRSTAPSFVVQRRVKIQPSGTSLPTERNKEQFPRVESNNAWLKGTAFHDSTIHVFVSAQDQRAPEDSHSPTLSLSSELCQQPRRRRTVAAPRIIS